MGAAGSYFYDVLTNPADANSRNNAKTDETARRKFLYIKGDGASDNGIDAALAPMPLVSYEENLLIWAECLLRVNNDEQGAIDKLNELRGHLRSGNAFNLIDAADTYQYDDYVLADFDNGYTTYMPFNDLRRLRKADSDLIVPFPFNTTSNTTHVERLLYPQAEIQTNPNCPNPIPDIFTPTSVNE